MGQLDAAGRFPGRIMGPQTFAVPLGGKTDHGIGQGQDGLGTAVVFFQLDNAGLGKGPGKVQNILYLGPPEAVDGLGVVPHHHEIPVGLDQRPDHLILQQVGILVFIYHHITIVFG